MDFSIRPANVEDCKDVARMIVELSEYEKVADQVKVTQRDLEQDGFSKNPFFHGIVAEVPEQHKTKEGHTKIGYALYFYSYSSWSGRAVYMEDLYVMPEFRGKGIGKALMSKVAQPGQRRCHRQHGLPLHALPGRGAGAPGAAIGRRPDGGRGLSPGADQVTQCRDRAPPGGPAPNTVTIVRPTSRSVEVIGCLLVLRPPLVTFFF
uniref:Spermidine/spermine N1-acetyltransferase family member 2a, tandem duplicate 1 n=1 Tax=Gasterosteus aculeatus aculeatus TaxID=481459 RepID=A0AAQ4REJ0_GASAC